MKDSIRSIIEAYAAQRGLRITAAVEELATLLSVSAPTLFSWMKGKSMPLPWHASVLQMIALPPGAKVVVLTYPNPADDDVDGNPSGGEIMRRKTLAAAALAGVNVQTVPFDREAYDRWRDAMPDTRALRAEWAQVQSR